MATVKTFRRSRWLNILGTIVCLLVFASPAFAGGGNVLPPAAQPKGYTLAAAAAATAYFNEAPTAHSLPLDFPFEMLYVKPENTFHVEPGTAFYVPVVYSDDTDAAYWSFPDVTDPQAVQDYYFDPAKLGAEYLDVVVDGEVTTLGSGYAVGAQTPGLPSGGNNYTVVAAFLSPLPAGAHTVTIAGRLAGAYIGGVYEFEITYTVIVG